MNYILVVILMEVLQSIVNDILMIFDEPDLRRTRWRRKLTKKKMDSASISNYLFKIYRKPRFSK